MNIRPAFGGQAFPTTKNNVGPLFSFSSPIQSSADNLNNICDLGSVKMGTDEIQYSWTIVKDNNWPNAGKVRSPTFWHKGSTEWCMELSVEDGKWYLCFHLLSSHREAWERATVRALLHIKGLYHEVYKDTVSLVILDANKKTREPSHKNCIISNNSEDFNQEIKLLGIVSIATVKMESSKTVVSHRETESISNDLGVLLDSGDYSDIVLCTGCTKISAHKAVLSARSQFFADMLRQYAQEAQISKIEIPDIDPETLHEVLYYIYTGKAPLIEKMPDKLLVAADKYGLLKLKEWCEEFLAKNLTVENAVATAVISLEHSCGSLKTAVINFIKKNIIRVICTNSWSDAVTQKSNVILEISNLLADEPINKQCQ